MVSFLMQLVFNCRIQDMQSMLNDPGMNSRAFEEKSQKSAKSEIFRNALELSDNNNLIGVLFYVAHKPLIQSFNSKLESLTFYFSL